MKKIALLFPGQGSQYTGMGVKLYENYASAREVFDQANEVLGFDLKKLCFEGDIKELTKTENTQPAILTMSVAAYRVFTEEFGIEPTYLAGHSLGEISALTCAGGIKFEDAVSIVRKRGKFMQEAVPVGVGTMAAIGGIDRETIENECIKHSDNNTIVAISNYNSPDQIVISGHAAAVKEVCEKLQQSGARAIPLTVSAPFHSPLMQPAADKLNEELKKHQFNSLKYDVISNVTALPYESSNSIVDNLSMQIVKPVQWIKSMKYLESQGIELVVELGPKTVLKNLMKKNVSEIRALSYDADEDIKIMNETISKTQKNEEPDKNMKFKFIGRCMGIAVCTPNSNWDNETYKKGVTEPYKKVKQMLEQLEQEGTEPTLEQMTEALNMLKSVFVTKGTPVQEQAERFNQIFDETGLKSLFKDVSLPM